MRKLVVRRAAKLDLAEARGWYDEQRPGLGRELVETVSESLDRIQEHPELYPQVDDQVHRAVLQRFPYAIFYIAKPDTIRVLAVLHHARSPEHWKRRARGQGKPARLPRRPGGWEGKIRIFEDFDAPLPEDLLTAFEGSLAGR